MILCESIHSVACHRPLGHDLLPVNRIGRGFLHSCDSTTFDKRLNVPRQEGTKSRISQDGIRLSGPVYRRRLLEDLRSATVDKKLFINHWSSCRFSNSFSTILLSVRMYSLTLTSCTVSISSPHFFGDTKLSPQ